MNEFTQFLKDSVAGGDSKRAGQQTGTECALLHLGFGLWGLACTLIMGTVLAVTCLWNGRSLAAPIAGHCLINTLIEPWLLLYVITYYARMFGGG